MELITFQPFDFNHVFGYMVDPTRIEIDIDAEPAAAAAASN
jgi:hypothetical protein